jgi:hypothetical protein
MRRLYRRDSGDRREPSDEHFRRPVSRGIPPDSPPLSNSSIDRSSKSSSVTPLMRSTPPPYASGSSQHPAHSHRHGYKEDLPPREGFSASGYAYEPPQRYGYYGNPPHHYAPPPAPFTTTQAPPVAMAGGYPVPGPSYEVVHTDDAATKLSDRVRRRCFNCCTTETSTWRRSSLNPGKVVNNKKKRKLLSHHFSFLHPSYL